MKSEGSVVVLLYIVLLIISCHYFHYWMPAAGQVQNAEMNCTLDHNTAQPTTTTQPPQNAGNSQGWGGGGGGIVPQAFDDCPNLVNTTRVFTQEHRDHASSDQTPAPRVYSKALAVPTCIIRLV